MMIRAVILLGLIGAVSSCGLFRPSAEAQAARLMPFRAKLAKGEDRRDFTVAVVNNGSGVEEVRESVRFPATRYCLMTFGGSEADWATDPATGDWAFVQDGDTLIFSGRCTKR